jgi:L-asparaginase
MLNTIIKITNNHKINPMKYKFTDINTLNKPTSNSSILIIYTGGTIGMQYDKNNKVLIPFDFEKLESYIPELAHFDINLKLISFETPIDSSNINTFHWIELAKIIKQEYSNFDGFVIIHGTDTMAYSASALSYLLENLTKPVIFTGAQLPIGAIRNDARENIITALEIASNKDKTGKPIIQEVAIYFNNFLLRGCRTKKVQTAQFDAFKSENYPILAEAGIQIDYNSAYIIHQNNNSDNIEIQENLDTNVAILKIYPGITKQVVESILNIDKLKGIVFESFGAGNAPIEQWLIDTLKTAIDKGIFIMNVSQCAGGKVIMGKYQTSQHLLNLGLINGSDITTEAAITKMMYVFGKTNDSIEIKNMLSNSLRGEMN